MNKSKSLQKLSDVDERKKKLLQIILLLMFKVIKRLFLYTHKYNKKVLTDAGFDCIMWCVLYAWSSIEKI